MQSKLLVIQVDGPLSRLPPKTDVSPKNIGWDISLPSRLALIEESEGPKRPLLTWCEKGLHLPRKAIVVSLKTLTTEGGPSSQTVRLLLQSFTSIPQLPGLPYTTVSIS